MRTHNNEDAPEMVSEQAGPSFSDQPASSLLDEMKDSLLFSLQENSNNANRLLQQLRSLNALLKKELDNKNLK